MRTAILLAAGVLLVPAPSPAAPPDPGRAWSELVRTPLRVTGNLLGAAGLFVASSVALAGDGVALLDTRARLPAPLSGPIHEIAMAFSRGGTGMMEGLRSQDIERFPEPLAAYESARPGRGRLDTFLSGVGAVRLAVRDAWSGPTVSVLSLVGSGAWAEGVARGREELRIRLLGPLSAPARATHGSEPPEAAGPRGG